MYDVIRTRTRVCDTCRLIEYTDGFIIPCMTIFQLENVPIRTAVSSLTMV
jgi:hypothetical protein